MERKKTMMVIMIVLVIILGIRYAVEKIQKERCYNMPVNQYVEDKSCAKFTWEQYMEEHYGK